MTKEKIKSLTAYLNLLNSRLADKTIPAKHVHRVESYKLFLNNEIRIVSNQLEAAKLESVK